jgi:hypothetical protein|tara:strand:- start:2847 stop:3503 length:657 start_codon:yes stop_codon:yes gene_type:complete
MFKTLSQILIFLLATLVNSNAEETKIFNFTAEELKKLQVRKVRGANEVTIYTPGTNDIGNFLKAETKNGGASGLGKEIKVNLNKTPFINITWKIEKGIEGINERSKKGHDFAARVFVIKKTGLTPLSNKAINYVFSSNEKVGQFWRSPYTKSSVDYVLSSTLENKNKWVTVKANVKEDFKKLHALDIDELSGIAIMTDTDQTEREVISFYQNIFFSSN